jgi:hypothetical protein
MEMKLAARVDVSDFITTIISIPWPRRVANGSKTKNSEPLSRFESHVTAYHPRNSWYKYPVSWTAIFDLLSTCRSS